MESNDGRQTLGELDYILATAQGHFERMDTVIINVKNSSSIMQKMGGGGGGFNQHSWATPA